MLSSLSLASDYLVPTEWKEIDDGISKLSYTFGLNLEYEEARTTLMHEEGVDPLVYLINSPQGEVGISISFIHSKCPENYTTSYKEIEDTVIYFHEEWVKAMKYCKNGNLVYTPSSDAGQNYVTSALKKAPMFVYFKIEGITHGVTAVGFTKAYNKTDKRSEKLKKAL